MFGSEFYSHPPLGFWLQSLLFRLLGDQFYIERLYSFIIFGMILFLMNRLLIELNCPRDSIYLSTLVFLSVPISSWVVRNNLLELPLCLFALAAVICFLKAVKVESFRYGMLGVIFIWCAMLSKGLTGAFPLVVPMLCTLIISDRKVFVIKLMACAIVLVISIALLFYFLIPEFAFYVQMYFQDQVIPALDFQEFKVLGRLKFLVSLIAQLLIAFGVLLISKLSLPTVANDSLSHSQSRTALFLFFLGLSSTLPLLISSKLSSFYVFPSIPYFSCAVGILVFPKVKHALLKLRVESMRKISGILLIVALVVLTHGLVLNYGEYIRDNQLIEYVDQIRVKNTGEKNVCSDDKTRCEDWLLIAYLQRLNGMSLSCDNRSACGYNIDR